MSSLLDVARLVLEALALDQIRNVVVVILALAGLALRLLHLLVALGELAEAGERVGTELVEDTGNELGQLLLLAVAVEGKGGGRNRGVD